MTSRWFVYYSLRSCPQIPVRCSTPTCPHRGRTGRRGTFSRSASCRQSTSASELLPLSRAGGWAAVASVVSLSGERADTHSWESGVVFCLLSPSLRIPGTVRGVRASSLGPTGKQPLLAVVGRGARETRAATRARLFLVFGIVFEAQSPCFGMLLASRLTGGRR